MRIEAVLLDLDETLVVEDESVAAAFLATCQLAEKARGVEAAKLHPAVLSHARELYHAFPLYGWYNALGLSTWEVLGGDVSGKFKELEVLKSWQPWFRLESWRLGLADFGVDDVVLMKKMAETFPLERAQRCDLFEDALPALEALKARQRLGLLSNGAVEIQKDKIRRCSLGEHFQAIVISGDYGYGKPDPRLFQAILKSLKIKAELAVMVGDSLRNDVGGARAVGCKCVWLNRRGQKPQDGDPTPDATITDLTQLEGTLRKL